MTRIEPEIGRAQTAWERSVDRRRLDDFNVTRALDLYFPLDGDVNEATGKAKDVRSVGGEACFDTGMLGRGLTLDKQVHLNAGDIADYDADDSFTLAAWVWPEKDCNGSIVSRTEDGAKPKGIDLVVRDGRVRVNLIAQWIDDAIRLVTRDRLPVGKWTHVAVTVDGSRFAKGVRVYFDGVPQSVDVEIDSLYQSFGNHGPLWVGASGDPTSHFHGRIDEIRTYKDELTPEEVEILATPKTVREIIAQPAGARTAGEARKLRECFLTNHAPPAIAAANNRLHAAEQALQQLIESFSSVMVMEEMTARRPAHVLFRGQYDQPRAEVDPGVPAVLPPLPAAAPRNRLGFAKWLVDPGQPLTGRVIVNRLWQMSFGTGLVKTAENFGAQGDPPSHPMLLDWLARELIDGGWNVKAMRRLIVTSATYRQSSHVSPKALAADPENRFLAPGHGFACRPR